MHPGENLDSFQFVVFKITAFEVNMSCTQSGLAANRCDVIYAHGQVSLFSFVNI